MPNPQTKKKNGSRNRSRRDTSQSAQALAHFLSIMPSQNLGSTTALSPVRSAPKRLRKLKPSARKPVRSGQVARSPPIVPLPPSVRFFLDNWHPFTQAVPLPFHTTNVEQTIAARGLRYTFEKEITCPANSTTWILIGSGDFNAVDETAQHTGSFVQNGVAYCFGPVQYVAPATPSNSCIGFMYQRLGSVGYPVSSNVAGNNTANDLLSVFSDSNQQWPIPSANPTDAVRWCPLSYGIDIRRTNAAMNSGGDWFSMTPANATLTSNQQLLRTNLNAYPSFKKHGSEHVNVQVMARPHDMAFQHAVAASIALTNPAIVLNFENGTSNALSFDMTVSAKYAVAGSLSEKLLSTTDASPAHAHLLAATASAVSAGVAPGHASTSVAEAVHAAVSTGKSAMQAAANVGAKFKAAGEWLKPLAGAAAGFSMSA